MLRNNLVIRGGADFSGFKRELNKAQTQLKGFQSQTKSIGNACIKMGTLIKSAFALAGVRALVNFSRESSEVATTTEASMNRVQDIFGQASSQIDSFYSETKSSLGMSQKAIYEYAATYGNLFSVFSSNQQNNAEMTQKYLTATAIIASKTGRTVSDVAERIRSGLLGNTEAIEDLGINVNIKTIEITKAFKSIANGRTWEQLNAYEQGQVRQLAILEQATEKYGTTVAQNGALVNQKFSASIENLQYTIGRFINQAIMPLKSWLTDVFNTLNDVLTAVFGFNKIQHNNNNVVGNQSNTIKESVENQNDLTDAVKQTGAAAKKTMAGFDQLNVLADNSGNGVSANEKSENASSPDTGTSENNSISSIDTQVSHTKAVISEMVGWIGGALRPIGDLFKTIFDDVTGNVLPTFISTFKEQIIPFFASVASEMLSAGAVLVSVFSELFTQVYLEGVAPALQLWAKIFDDMWVTIKSVWDKYGTPIFDLIRESIQAVADVWKSIWENLLRPIWQNFMDTIDWLWTKHLQPLLKNFLEFTAEVATAIMELYNGAIAPLVKWIVDVLGPVFAQVFNGIVNVVGTTIAFIADIINSLITVLKGIIQFITGVFTGDWSKAWEGIKNILKGAWEAFVGIVKAPINLIIDALNLFIGGVASMVSSMINLVVGGINTLVELALVPLNLLIDGINKIPGIDLQSLELSIPSVPDFGQFVPKIPKLAQGAVIPPNQEFMAILGDQRSGLNIETPLETMIQAFKTALGEGQGQAANITLMLDGRVLGKVTIDQINSITQTTGVSPILV